MSIESSNYIEESIQSEKTYIEKTYEPNNELKDIRKDEQVDELKDNIKDYIFGLNIEFNGMTSDEINKEISQKISLFLDFQGGYIQSLPKEEKNKIIQRFLAFGNDLKSKFDDGIITNDEMDELLHNFITRT